MRERAKELQRERLEAAKRGLPPRGQPSYGTLLRDTFFKFFFPRNISSHTSIYIYILIKRESLKFIYPHNFSRLIVPNCIILFCVCYCLDKVCMKENYKEARSGFRLYKIITKQ